MAPRRAAGAVCVMLAAAAGCAGSGLLPGPHPATTHEPALDPESTKEITAKRQGAFVARDGTWCPVADDVVRATPVGRLWRCRWRRSV